MPVETSTRRDIPNALLQQAALRAIEPYKIYRREEIFSEEALFSYATFAGTLGSIAPEESFDDFYDGRIDLQQLVKDARQARVQALNSFFGPEGIDVPNSHQLSLFLAQIHPEDFLTPTEHPDTDFIQSEANSYLKGLDHLFKPVPVELVYEELSGRRSPNDLRNSKVQGRQMQMQRLHAALAELVDERPTSKSGNMSAAVGQVKLTAKALVHTALWQPMTIYIPRPSLRSIARPHTVAPQISDEIEEDVLHACQWIVVADKLRQIGSETNPFIHQVNLDRLGLVRINFVEGDSPDTGKVVVTVPKPVSYS